MSVPTITARYEQDPIEISSLQGRSWSTPTISAEISFEHGQQQQALEWIDVMRDDLIAQVRLTMETLHE